MMTMPRNNLESPRASDRSFVLVENVVRTTLKRAGALAALLSAGITLTAAPSWGQIQIPRNGPLDQISTKPQVIRAQVELGAKLAVEALTILETTDDPEQLEKAKDLVNRSYVLLRFAAHGVELRKTNANIVENRLMVMALDNINAARTRNRHADLAIGNSIPWPETRAQFVSEAMDLLRPVPELAQRAAPLIR